MAKKAVLLELDEALHADCKSRAKAADLTLSAWIRMKCSLVENTLLDEHTNAVSCYTPKQAMQATAVNESNEKYYHTAASHRHTCKCPSCVDYRERNDIPFGGCK